MPIFLRLYSYIEKVFNYKYLKYLKIFFFSGYSSKLISKVFHIVSISFFTKSQAKYNLGKKPDK